MSLITFNLIKLCSILTELGCSVTLTSLSQRTGTSANVLSKFKPETTTDSSESGGQAQGGTI